MGGSGGPIRMCRDPLSLSLVALNSEKVTCHENRRFSGSLKANERRNVRVGVYRVLRSVLNGVSCETPAFTSGALAPRLTTL